MNLHVVLGGTLRTLCAASLVVSTLAPPTAVLARQTASSQVDTTQVAALVRYPAFYHARTVVVQGTVRLVDGESWIEESAEVRLRLLGGAEHDGKRMQVKGTLVDVGRLSPTDPRAAKWRVDALVARLSRGQWPRSGQLVVLCADQVAAYSPAPAPASFQAVVLDPDRYQNQAVVVIGQFRGRNLVGDLPAAPGRDTSEFVLRNGTSTLWVAGRKPQGLDFKLDPADPKGVGRWLRVSGVVRRQNALVYLEATAVERGDSAPETGSVGSEGTVSFGPLPSITYSSPVANGGDIARNVVVRVQFSRVMNADSFVGRVRSSYVDGGSPGSATPRDPEFTALYVLKDQVLELRFAGLLEPNRRVKIELLEGIATPDGSPLKPWTLTFTTSDRRP